MAPRRRQSLAGDLAQQVISPQLHASTSSRALRLEAEAEVAKARMSYAGVRKVQQLRRAQQEEHSPSSPDHLERVLLVGALAQVTGGWFVRTMLTLLLGLALLIVVALLFSAAVWTVLWAVGAPQRSLYQLAGDVLLEITLFFRNLFFAVF